MNPQISGGGSSSRAKKFEESSESRWLPCVSDFTLKILDPLLLCTRRSRPLVGIDSSLQASGRSDSAPTRTWANRPAGGIHRPILIEVIGTIFAARSRCLSTATVMGPV
jgi:hypothetical protein